MAGFKGFVAVLAAGSLFVSSTAAVAATSSAPVPQVNPWAALAVMSGAAPVVALCNGQTPVDPTVPPPPGVTNGCILPVTDVAVPPVPQQAGPPPPIPVPPVEPAGVGLGIDPLYLGLAAILVGVGLYFLLKKKGGNSPT